MPRLSFAHMEQLLKNSVLEDEAIPLEKIKSADVVTQRGQIVGKVRGIRLDPKDFSFAGVVVSTSMTHPTMYIAKEYVAHLATDAILLKVEPSVLLKGKQVITYAGARVGKVKQVNRVKHSNTIESLIVKPSIIKKSVTIKANDVKSIGNKTVILKESYDNNR